MHRHQYTLTCPLRRCHCLSYIITRARNKGLFFRLIVISSSDIVVAPVCYVTILACRLRKSVRNNGEEGSCGLGLCYPPDNEQASKHWVSRTRVRPFDMSTIRIILLIASCVLFRPSNAQYEVWEHARGYDGYTPALIEVAQLLLRDLIEKRRVQAATDYAGDADNDANAQINLAFESTAPGSELINSKPLKSGNFGSMVPPPPINDRQFNKAAETKPSSPWEAAWNRIRKFVWHY